jgi:hypothetical protein
MLYPQAFFKEAYKARMRNKTDGDEGRSSSRGGSRGGQKPDGWLENLCQVRGLAAAPPKRKRRSEFSKLDREDREETCGPVCGRQVFF